MTSSDATFQHEPVMEDEITEVFASVPHGVVVDATLGGAGHSLKLLQTYAWMRVLGIDRDPLAVAASEMIAASHPEIGDRLVVRHGRFDQLPQIMKNLQLTQISGALFDLGVSSPQFDRPERGFSYRHDGPLDMRMDTTAALSAADVVNNYDTDRLTQVIREHSDERFAFRIAKAIVAHRPISTTTQLAEIVSAAIPAPARRTGGHPAKRTFQAIRIEVNNELDMLPGALDNAIEATVAGGRIAVLTYHSGEDRIVKRTFRDAEMDPTVENVATPFTHPLQSAFKRVRRVRVRERPSADEIARNPRAKSARLRVIEKSSLFVAPVIPAGC
ncbi:MAG: 16S rRNA (cytosine(1402)-N(4))-methyltransferase RsmH [Ilumatobacteraceae bacterium]